MDSILAAIVLGHDELVDLLTTMLREMVAGRYAGVEIAFGAFSRWLKSHIRIEEEVVFPVAMGALDVGGAVVSALQKEHVCFQELCDEIAGQLQRSEWTTAIWNLRELEAALKVHEQREEQVLFPLVEARLRAPTLRELTAVVREKQV